MSRIVAAEKLNDHYIAYEIEAAHIASRSGPGQLVEARLGGRSHPVPHAIADCDPDRGSVTIVTRLAHGGEAAGTELSAGTEIDLSGPIGRRSAASPVGKVLCIGEGLGVAALLTRVREYKATDAYTIVIAGFRSKEFVYWADRLDPLSDELYVVTADGSYGIKGPIKETIKGVCQHVPDIDRAIAAGPLSMLRTCCDITTVHGIPTVISLAAVVEEDELIASPGGAASRYDWNTASELDGHKVDFDDLMQKLGIPTAK